MTLSRQKRERLSVNHIPFLPDGFAARIAVARRRARHGLKNPWALPPSVRDQPVANSSADSRRSTSKGFSPQSYNLCDERFIPGLGIAEARHVSELSFVVMVGLLRGEASMMLCGAIVGMIRVTLKSAPSNKSRNSDCVRKFEEIR
jgi:hypothetical protein